MIEFHPRRLHRRVDDSDPCGLEDRVERGAEAGVPVMQHEPRPDAGVIEIHQEVPGLLHHPGLDRVLRGSENPDPAAAVLDDGQDVHLGAAVQAGGEEVQRQDRLCPGSQELGPARAVPAGRRVDVRVLEDLPGR